MKSESFIELYPGSEFKFKANCHCVLYYRIDYHDDAGNLLYSVSL